VGCQWLIVFHIHPDSGGRISLRNMVFKLDLMRVTVREDFSVLLSGVKLLNLRNIQHGVDKWIMN
jgi:hypothetical protein